MLDFLHLEYLSEIVYNMFSSLNIWYMDPMPDLQ